MIFDSQNMGFDELVARVRELNSGLDKKFYVVTFGCQQNEADSEKIRGIAAAMGYLAADKPEDADFIVVNTCAIREHAEMKALSMIGRFKALKKSNSELIIGVVGCMAAEPHRAELLKKDFHYVSFTLEPNMLHRIPELVLKAITEKRRSFVFGTDCGDITEGLPAVRSSGHKAWVSVMYGCNNFCTYCIVPYVRGRERSRDSSAIIDECRELVSSGVKEITLLGQNVNSYRSDMNFAELVSAIARIEGDFIIRFMTSHPKDTSDELIRAMEAYRPKIAPYFHLPLQSGSNAILKKMNRTYTKEQFLSVVDKLRQSVPNIALSTDVIVGFPGESEEDFLETLDVLARVKFDLVYSFLYSPREGTRAASMTDVVPRQIMGERMDRLLCLQDEISYNASLGYLDTVCRVLTDSAEQCSGKLIYTGRTDTNKLVHFEAANARVGEFTNVRIKKVGAFDLIGVEER